MIEFQVRQEKKKPALSGGRNPTHFIHVSVTSKHAAKRVKQIF
mgnify:CR=1 FL=1